MAEGKKQAPSAWIKRFAGLIAPQGAVLDLACGRGRHCRMLRDMGYYVTAVDRDTAQLGALGKDSGVEVIAADLEDGSPWPLAERQFAGVVVANYLWRPLLDNVVAAVAPGGVLIYETFAVGNEAYGRPSNPDFLLRPGELLDCCRGALSIVVYEHGLTGGPAVVQRICAVRAAQPQRLTGEA